jgi:hypothetical protein
MANNNRIFTGMILILGCTSDGSAVLKRLINQHLLSVKPKKIGSMELKMNQLAVTHFISVSERRIFV